MIRIEEVKAANIEDARGHVRTFQVAAYLDKVIGDVVAHAPQQVTGKLIALIHNIDEELVTTISFNAVVYIFTKIQM